MRPHSIPSGRQAPGHRGETLRPTERKPPGTWPLSGRAKARPLSRRHQTGQTEAVTDLAAGRGAGGLEMTRLVVEGGEGQVTRSLQGRKGRNVTNKEKEL